MNMTTFVIFRPIIKNGPQNFPAETWLQLQSPFKILDPKSFLEPELIFQFPIIFAMSCNRIEIGLNKTFINLSLFGVRRNIVCARPVWGRLGTLLRRHRWVLPVNYPVFSVVMVIYHYVERICRVLVIPNFLYNMNNHE